MKFILQGLGTGMAADIAYVEGSTQVSTNSKIVVEKFTVPGVLLKVRVLFQNRIEAHKSCGFEFIRQIIELKNASVNPLGLCKMTNEIASTYSIQIISVINTLEEQLKSIMHSQNELIKVISIAQSTCITEQELADIKKMMDKVSIYNTKLLSLKATMSMLTGRSKQLQVKADKLKQTKIQYLSQIDKIRKMEQEKDQIIAAKTSTTKPIINSSESMLAIPKIKSIAKKKKKTKTREALIIGDDDNDDKNWVPKRSTSQKDLFLKKA